jgi:hypothetical protein
MLEIILIYLECSDIKKTEATSNIQESNVYKVKSNTKVEAARSIYTFLINMH